MTKTSVFGPRDIMTPFSAWSVAGALPPARGWSEQALLSTMWGEHATPLEARYQSLIHALGLLGPQQVVASNQVGALGLFAPLAWQAGDQNEARLGTTGVDIAIDFRRIGALFATGAPRTGVLPPAIRLFDHYGDGLLTLAPGPRIDRARFEAFVRRHRRAAAPPLPQRPPPAPRPLEARPGARKLQAAVDDWLRDSPPPPLESLLKTHRITRSDLYAAAPPERARTMKAGEMVEVMHMMVERRAPMALQVGRAGVVMVARVRAEEVQVTREGVEICGASAVLRLNPRRLRNAWMVRTPTARGIESTIELLDESGDLAVCIGGAEQAVAAGMSGWTREPYRPEL
jgi:putative hemin transport protein